jgi:hypothetical protein
MLALNSFAWKMLKTARLAKTPIRQFIDPLEVALKVRRRSGIEHEAFDALPSACAPPFHRKRRTQ